MNLINMGQRQQQ